MSEQKKLFIAGNWKMNLSLESAKQLAHRVSELAKECPSVDVGIFPSFVYVPLVKSTSNEQGFFLGAQNCCVEPYGAFTGEVSASMLREVGCTHVLIGHSERRTVFHEKNEDTQQKVAQAQKEGLTVVLCVGETLQERDSHQTLHVVRMQLEDALHGVQTIDPNKLLVAYEPVWAIGTGLAASAEQAEEVHKFIFSVLESIFQEAASTIRILYGGSVNEKNAIQFFDQEHIHGALVGGASLKIESFSSIVISAAR